MNLMVTHTCCTSVFGVNDTNKWSFELVEPQQSEYYYKYNSINERYK